MIRIITTKIRDIFKLLFAYISIFVAPQNVFIQTIQLVYHKSAIPLRKWIKLTKINNIYLETIHSKSLLIRNITKGANKKYYLKFFSNFASMIPEQFIATIPSGKFNYFGMVKTGDNKVLIDLFDSHYKHFNIFRKYLNDKNIHEKHITGKIAVLSEYVANSYFYWILSTLPRLLILKKNKDIFESIDKVALNWREKNYQVESLNEIGINKNKIFTTQKDMWITSDTLILPSFSCRPGNPATISKFGCSLLRQEFISGRNEFKKKQKIYISRARSRKRMIINEPATHDLLESRGFKICSFELMSFRDQVKTMANANLVVAPHGAGLTNIAFCDPGTKILEIFSPAIMTASYWMLSNALDLEYYFMQGNKYTGTESIADKSVGTPFVIDLSVLTNILDIIDTP